MPTNLIFKISTKEKMYVILLEKLNLTAIMTEEFKNALLPYLQKSIKNLVIDFSKVQSIDTEFAKGMVNIQQYFYKNNASMVYCNFPTNVKSFLSEHGLIKDLNITPTESEAWDMVQMEEIEREFL